MDDRRLAELEQTARRDRAIIDSVGDGLLVLDVEGRITFVNPAGAEQLGYAPAELIGVPGHATVHHSRLDGQPYPASECPGNRALSEGLETRGRDEIYWRKDGTPLHVEYTTTPIREGGRITGAVIAFRDISARKTMERVEEQLRRSQRLEAIGSLAGGVAHDFNNLLTAILGAVELLLERIPEFDPARAEAVDIQQAAQRAAALTRQLLTFSRRQVVQPQVLDLNEIVTGMGRMLHRVIGEDVELVMACDPALPHVRIDPGQMEQVIMNLAVNARDAMPRGGRLVVETGSVHLVEDEVRQRIGLSAGDYVVLSVSDDGSGMTAEVQARLFDPFFTTKAAGKGTGLGLSTVYGIVKQANGEISVYSELGKGSVFRIYLPATSDAAAATAGEPAASPSERGTGTLLIVEDEPLVRSMATRVLRIAGYTVLTAGDGAEALRVAGERSRPVDLLVTDVVMPQIGGEDLAARLRALWPGLLVLYISGYTERGFASRGLAPGSAFLQKPFTPAALAHRVRELLDTRPAAGRGAK